jgi:hypothetical protein
MAKKVGRQGYDSEKEAVEIRQLATEMMHGAFANTKSYKAGVQT